MSDHRLIIATMSLFVGSLSACKQDPSFRLRWSLDGEALERPSQCSERGVFTVEAEAFDGNGDRVAMRRYPCFPNGFEDADRLVDGPTLPAGAYAVRVMGVNRALAPWHDAATLEQERFAAETQGKDYDSDAEFERCRALVDNPACRAEQLVCDCATVQVADDGTVELDGFALGRPPECADGIDNDRDGVVDVNDPSCVGGFSVDRSEGLSVAASEFDLRVSFLGYNPAASCVGLGVDVIEVRLGDELLASTSSCDLDLRFSAIIDESVADGPPVDGVLPVTLSVHALASGGGPVAQPVEIPLQVQAGVPDFHVLQADFPVETFVDPIVAAARFRVGFELSGSPSPRYCEANTSEGMLAITHVRMTWLDAHGRPLDPPLVLLDGGVLDGSEVTCQSDERVTPDLSWGDYLLAVEGLSAEGEVCFSNLDAPARVAPTQSFIAVVPRVSSSGSCRDCAVDSDCAEGTASCVDGVCIP